MIHYDNMRNSNTYLAGKLHTSVSILLCPLITFSDVITVYSDKQTETHQYIPEGKITRD
jgi:hypothetical protein